MKITSEIPLRRFRFWDEASDNAEELTPAQLDEVESQLEELYPDGIDEEELNDFFHYEFDTIKDWLGIYDDEDEDEEEDEDF